MQKAALCGLGQAAPIPVDTTLLHFGHEYQRKLDVKGKGELTYANCH